MKTITEDQLNKIYEEETGSSVLYAEKGDSLSSVINMNTEWFIDNAHETEHLIWKRLEKLGINGIDEVKIK